MLYIKEQTLQKVNRVMQDNSDIQEIHDGKITDMRIEVVLGCIVESKWTEPSLDQLYTEIVREFIYPDAPLMLISAAGRHPQSAAGLLYLSLFAIDYELVHVQSDDWPGDFDYLDRATCAVRLRYPQSDACTEWSPGITPSQAAICALMQLCRELSLGIYNKESGSPIH